MKTIVLVILCAFLMGQALAQTKQNEKPVNMKQTEQTDFYTFKLSDKVTRQKVNFKNRYGITLSGDLYLPKNGGSEPFAALAVNLQLKVNW